MAAALTMRGASLEQGLFGCCSSCHAAFGEELSGKSWLSRDRQYPFAGSRGVPLPAALASARGGDERSDWTPRAAVATGSLSLSPRSLLTSPPPALLVDVPSGGRRPVTPPAARDPAAKALERQRLRRLVQEFTQEAGSGRPCTIVVLDSHLERGNGAAGDLRREARYTLGEEVERFTLLGRTLQHADADQGADWEPLGQWPLEAVLGTHRAEESALVQSHLHELNRVVSREEFGRAAVLEFGGGAFAGCVPLLLIEESPDHRERFVSGMQILRLYKGAAQRLESARHSSDRRHDSPATTGVSPNVTAVPENASNGPTESPSGPRSPPAPDSARLKNVRVHRPLGMTGVDPPADDGLPCQGAQTPTETAPPLS